MIFLITQRLIETEYDDKQECLDVNWYRFISKIKNAQLIPISHCSKVFPDLVNLIKIDGIILSGGNDLYYVCPNKINKLRDDFEIELYKNAILYSIPVFAVCRGAQLLAEYYGATIKKVNNHINCKHDCFTVDNGNYILPKQVNSYHKYGIYNLENQKILAKDNDGCIEAFLCPGAFCCMWHPERHPQDLTTFKQYFNIDDCKAIVLCAGQGTRLRPLTNNIPKCMVKYKDVRIINYCYNALTTQIDKDNITFVTGYLNNKLQMKPVKKIFSKNYESTNMLVSLFLALESGPVIISYSDIVYNPTIVEKLINCEHDISVVVDHNWFQLWSKRMENPLNDVETLRFGSDGTIIEIGNKPTQLKEVEAQYIGLIKLSQKGIDIFKLVAKELDITKMSITPFLQEVINRGYKVYPVNIYGEWIEIDSPSDLLVDIDTSWYKIKHHFGTKASNIKRLSKMDLNCVLPYYCFTIKEWKQQLQPSFKEFVNQYSQVIIRSSAVDEDNIKESNAGMYDSVIANIETVDKAVLQVIESYNTENDNHQILVQPFVDNAIFFGVAFSHIIDTHSPYYVVSYGSKYNDVTGGNKCTTFYHYHNYLNYFTKWESSLYTLIQRCKLFFDHQYLDIEFCVLKDNKIKLLQIRPITTLPINIIDIELESISSFLKTTLNKKYDTLYGNRTFFDNMSDWNPAEIIGTVPTRLSASLYEELITDKVALQSRASYGYKDVSMHPLMVNIYGAYYIDIRVVFNSYLPAKTNKQVAEKLINYYLCKFSENIHLRDKIEFEILYTCFDPNMDLSHILTKNEELTFKQHLLEISKNAFLKIDSEIEKINYLNKQIENCNDLCMIIALCKEYGTNPFTGLARTAFIATVILNSLSISGHYKETLPYKTVSTEFLKHKQLVMDGKLCCSIFKKWYGHLRPGTYNLLSPSYKNNFSNYFPELNSLNVVSESFLDYQYQPGISKINTPKKLQEYLYENGWDMECKDFLNYAKKAIEGREYAKFIFTKCVSKILDIIGNDYDNQFLDIKDIICNRKSNIKYWRKEYQTALNRVNPNTILSEIDIFHILCNQEIPNFVSNKIIVADITTDTSIDVNGKIVLLKAADPGYDWLFSKGIIGLITCYGGANSHMVIRANELNLPSAIGIGENKFNELKNYKTIVLDCKNKNIKKI